MEENNKKLDEALDNALGNSKAEGKVELSKEDIEMLTEYLKSKKPTKSTIASLVDFSRLPEERDNNGKHK